jgi:ABC-type multidrug transport system permease subunit
MTDYPYLQLYMAINTVTTVYLFYTITIFYYNAVRGWQDTNFKCVMNFPMHPYTIPFITIPSYFKLKTVWTCIDHVTIDSLSHYS